MEAEHLLDGIVDAGEQRGIRDALRSPGADRQVLAVLAPDSDLAQNDRLVPAAAGVDLQIVLVGSEDLAKVRPDEALELRQPELVLR